MSFLVFFLIQPEHTTFIDFYSKVFETPINKSEYILYPGDSVLVVVNAYTFYSYSTSVTPSGEILLYIPTGYQISTGELTLGGIRLLDLNPVDGIYVAGLSVKEAEKKLEKGAKKYLSNVRIKIVLLRPAITKVYVIGKVNNPGVYPVSSLMRVSEVVAMAEPSFFASNHVLIITDKDTMKINLKKFYKEGDLRNNPRIIPGAIIYVPKAKKYVYIAGGVIPPWIIKTKEFLLSEITDTAVTRGRKTWVYEIDEGETLKDLIDYIRGVQIEVDVENCYIKRNGKKIKFNFNNVVTGKRDVFLKHKDTVVLPLKRNTVYVSGEVKKPGRFPYNEVRTVEDYIGNAGGFIYTADVRNIQIISPNGRIRRVKPSEVPAPGDMIFVPRRAIYSWRDAITFSSAVLGLIMAILEFGK